MTLRQDSSGTDQAPVVEYADVNATTYSGFTVQDDMILSISDSFVVIRATPASPTSASVVVNMHFSETLEIQANPTYMSAIADGERDLASGDIVPGSVARQRR